MNPKDWTREEWREFWKGALCIPALIVFYLLMWIIV